MENELAELKAKRNELVEAAGELDTSRSLVEYYELMDEISEIDRKVHAIDPSQV